jgi:hypothetical protein
MASSSKLRCQDDTPPDVPPKSARMFDGRITPPLRNPFAPTMNSSTTTTPSSALEGRSSPNSWRVPKAVGQSGHSRNASDGTSLVSQHHGHQRSGSDVSVMERGRPKKRSDGSPVKASTSRHGRNPSAEQKAAFVTLPSGTRATEASTKLEMNEIEVLRKQAIGQAAKFEVLCAKDVDSLSRVSPWKPIECNQYV